MKRLLAILLLVLTPTTANAAITVLHHAVILTAAETNTSITSSSYDTTGATLIVISGSWYSSAGDPTLTDSKGNTWTKLTNRTNANQYRTSLWYCVAPTVGSGHTFTLSGTQYEDNGLGILVLSGTAASPYDQESGAGSATPGSLTPPEDNCIVVSSAAREVTGPTLASWTTQTATGSNNVAAGTALAYKIQTTAGAENPTWTNAQATAMAVFKSAAADPPSITTSGTQTLEESERDVVTVAATGGATPYVWSITGGADQALFAINSSTGALTMPGSADYENPEDADTNNVYVVEVTCTDDDSATDALTINVTVTDEGGAGTGFSAGVNNGPIR